jgi:hypothetical protein
LANKAREAWLRRPRGSRSFEGPEASKPQAKYLGKGLSAVRMDLLAAHLTQTVGITDVQAVRAYAAGLVEEGCDSIAVFDDLEPQELIDDFGFKKLHARAVAKYRQANSVQRGLKPRTASFAESPTPHSERWTAKRLMSGTPERDSALQELADAHRPRRWKLQPELGQAGHCRGPRVHRQHVRTGGD